MTSQDCCEADHERFLFVKEERNMTAIPRIDMVNTGLNIVRLRKEKNISVKDMQNVLGFNTPQAIFKWQRGDSLPTVDNLVILSQLFNVSMEEILSITVN